MTRITLLAAAGVLAAATLAGCGSGGDPLDAGDGTASEAGTIRVGSANFPENVVLAEVYAQALEARGFEVETTLNIGSREAYLKALTDSSPSLDVFPEYAASLRNYFAPDSPGTSTEDVVAELKESLPAGLTVLEPAEAQDKDAVVVTPETAEKYGLTSIADLKPIAGDLTLGGPPEWKTRSTGVPGLEAKYGVIFGSFKELDAGGKLSHDGLVNGQVDAANIFTTDPDVASGALVALEDPNNLFASENVIPLVRDEVVTPELTDTLNAVSAALSQQALLDLVDAAVAQKQDPEDVAHDFLEANGLL